MTPSAPQPPPDAPPQVDAKAIVQEAFGLDDQQLSTLEAPMVTAESVVATFDVLQYVGLRLYGMAKRVEWNERCAAVAHLTPQEKSELKGMAPWVLPYVQEQLSKTPWLGAAVFGALAVSVVSSHADQLSRIAREQRVERARRDGMPPPAAPAPAPAPPAPVDTPLRAKLEAEGLNPPPWVGRDHDPDWQPSHGL